MVRQSYARWLLRSRSSAQRPIATLSVLTVLIHAWGSISFRWGVTLAQSLPPGWWSAVGVATHLVHGTVVLVVVRSELPPGLMASLAFSRSSIRDSVAWISATALLAAGLSTVAAAIASHGTVPFDPIRGYPDEFKSPAVMLLNFACIDALFEELVFRGLLFQWLRTRYSTTTSLMLTSTSFALTHARPTQWPIAFLFGLLAGLARARSQSLITPIVCHAVFNAVLVVAFLVLSPSR